MGRVMGLPRPRIITRKLSSTQAQVLVGYLLRYQSEFTELAESRFSDCDSCGMTQGAFDPICCGFAGYVHNNKTT